MATRHATKIAEDKGLIRIALEGEIGDRDGNCIACHESGDATHLSECVIDEALRLAGYPDRPSRTAARLNSVVG